MLFKLLKTGKMKAKLMCYPLAGKVNFFNLVKTANYSFGIDLNQLQVCVGAIALFSANFACNIAYGQAMLHAKAFFFLPGSGGVFKKLG